jgi:hypothetical protein
VDEKRLIVAARSALGNRGLNVANPRAEIIAAPMIGSGLHKMPARKDGQNKTGRGFLRGRFV